MAIQTTEQAVSIVAVADAHLDSIAGLGNWLVLLLGGAALSLASKGEVKVGGVSVSLNRAAPVLEAAKVLVLGAVGLQCLRLAALVWASPPQHWTGVFQTLSYNQWVFNPLAFYPGPASAGFALSLASHVASAVPTLLFAGLHVAGEEVSLRLASHAEQGAGALKVLVWAAKWGAQATILSLLCWLVLNEAVAFRANRFPPEGFDALYLHLRGAAAVLVSVFLFWRASPRNRQPSKRESQAT